MKSLHVFRSVLPLKTVMAEIIGKKVKKIYMVFVLDTSEFC